MKKILLNVALIASMAVSAYAQGGPTDPEVTLTTDWGYVVKNKVSNPIPNDFCGGWGGVPTEANPNAPAGNTCTRFGVGKDGKILVQYHKNNTISALSADGTLETYVQLPAITLDKWNGTAIATDDAGNVIYNYCFTNAEKSVKYWGVVNKDKKISTVNVSDADYKALNAAGRLDIISHIVGDVTSAEGGIGYACLANYGKVVMYHFKGDGSKVTSVTVKASSNNIEMLPKSYSNGGATQPCAKYFTVKEILAEENPADAFLLPLGALAAANAETTAGAGMLGMYVDGEWTTRYGFGNRSYETIATFKLAGKQYVVRSYMDENSEMYNTVMNAEGTGSAFSTWANVMTFGVYELETGALVASWQGSGLANAYGYGTMSVEPIDNNTVRIYNYACVGSVYNQPDNSGSASGTYAGCYCAVTTLKVKSNEPTPGEIAGSGTETDPYLISCKEDLLVAYTKIEPKKMVYFKQTADIDMAGVKEYVALNGNKGGFFDPDYNDYKYNSAFVYDGGNHLIKNFAPTDVAAENDGKATYYCSSIFGVIAGTVRNLGVVNANIKVTDNLGGGILGAYFGHGDALTHAPVSKIENVFVQGTVSNAKASSYAGGFIGTNSTVPCEITNCYALVDVVSTDASAYVGVIEARLRGKDNVVLNNVYGAGTAEFAEGAKKDNVGLLFSSDKDTGISLDGANLIGFGEGDWAGEGLMVDSKLKAEMFAAKDAAGIAKVQGWAAFSNKVMWNEYPTLNWNSGVGNIFADEVDENAPVEYYNLSGVRVANPTPGIYVKKQGTKVTKVIVR